MAEQTDELLEIARLALERTESRDLEWHKTGEVPQEHFAHLTPRYGLAIRRVVPVLPRHGEVRPAAEEAGAQLSGYELALVTVDGAETAHLSSWDPPLGSGEADLLQRLFAAAERSNRAHDSSVAEVLNALRQAQGTNASSG